jgi:hypothetical protein
MDVRAERIQDAHIVTAREKLAKYMFADKAGSPRKQDLHSRASPNTPPDRIDIADV